MLTTMETDRLYNLCKELKEAEKYDNEDVMSYVSAEDLIFMIDGILSLVDETTNLKSEIYKLRNATLYDKKQ